ncbi:MAG: hypothetical protein AB7I37_12450 [Pirellulales bacterium]
MFNAAHRLLLGLCWAAVLGTAATSRADQGTLADCIPADAGLCLEFNQLPAGIGQFADSPLGRRLKRFPPLAALAGADGASITHLANKMAAEIGLPADEMARRLFGGRMALAVWSSGDRQPGEQLVLHLVEADDEAYLKKAVAGLYASEERSGELKSQSTVEHAGQSYQVRTLVRGNRERRVCVSVVGRLGIVSGSERLMRQALQLAASKSQNASGLSALPAYQAALAKSSPTAHVRAFIQPRAWDQEVASRLGPATAQDKRAVARQRLLSVWKSVSSITATLELSDQPRFEAFLAITAEEIPRGLEDALGGLAGEAAFLKRIPANSLLAVAGHIDPRQLSALAALSPAAGKAATITELLDAALGGLGPNAGLALLPAEKQEQQNALQGVVGLQVGNRLEGDDAGPGEKPTDGLRDAVQAALDLAVRSANERHPASSVALKSHDIKGLPGWLLSSVEKKGDENSPAASEPIAAIGLADRLLLVGNSSAAVAAAVGVPPEESLAHSASFHELLSPRLAAPGQVFYLNAAALRRALADHPQSAIDFASRHRGATPEQARRALQQLGTVLALVDRIAATATVDRSGVGISNAIATDNESANNKSPIQNPKSKIQD